MNEIIGPSRKPESESALHAHTVKHEHMSALDRLGWLMSAMSMTSIVSLMVWHPNGLSGSLTLIGLGGVLGCVLMSGALASTLERHVKRIEQNGKDARNGRTD